MRSGLNLDEIDLCAGIADARLQVDEFHFGRGIALSRTFAHLSAPSRVSCRALPGISGMPLCSSPEVSTSWRSSIFPSRLRPELATGDLEEPVARTCGLVRQTLTRIFDNGFVPTIPELEAGLRAH